MTLPPSFHYNSDAQILRLSPRDMAFVQNPYRAYAALHDASGPSGPAVYWEDYGHWVFGGLDTVNALFRDKRLGRQILHLTTREALGWPPRPPHLADFDALEAHSLLELERPDHTRLRGLITRAFVSRQIETLGPSIAALTADLLGDLPTEEPVDLIAHFAEPLAVSVIADMLGIDRAMGPQLLAWSHAMVRMYQAESTFGDAVAANSAAAEFANFVRGEIHKRRDKSHKKNDLLTHLVEATDDTGRLSEDEMVSTVILLLNAGHEATVHSLGHALQQLLQIDRNTREYWLADPEILTEEVLRHKPPLHMFTRYILEDCELLGQSFKQGDIIGLHLGMANRDPRAMPDPDIFDPARAPIKNVAFGAGIHFCIGHALARLEIETALPMVFQRFSTMHLAGRAKLKDAYHFHGLESVSVILS